MAIDIKIPEFSESISEGTVGTWIKNVGDKVVEGETVVEIETDKVVLEIPAPASGVIEEIIKNENETVSDLEVIGRMSARKNMERRLSVRRPTSENVYLYCKQLELERCKPSNISSRGVFIDFVPKRAYVGRRIQLVFVIDRGRTAKMIRVFAVIAHISQGGIGFGFIGKHIPTRRGDGLPKRLSP